MADTLVADPPAVAADKGADTSTPPTRQPVDPTEGGSKGPEDPTKLPPVPPTEKPDPGIEQHPTKAPPVPPVVPEVPKEPAAADVKAAPPEVKYDLKLPDNSGLDAHAVERTVAHAKARGLSQPAAQAALDLVAQEVAQVNAAADAEFKAKVEEWKATAAADATLGKTPEERTAAVLKGKQVLDKYASQYPERGQALKTFLNDTGYGEHPAVVGWFAWLGAAAGEGPLVMPTPDSGAKPRSVAEVFYGPDGGRAAQAEREAAKRARDGG
jgi:hypothetical protein